MTESTSLISKLSQALISAITFVLAGFTVQDKNKIADQRLSQFQQRLAEHNEGLEAALSKDSESGREHLLAKAQIEGDKIRLTILSDKAEDEIIHDQLHDDAAALEQYLNDNTIIRLLDFIK